MRISDWSSDVCSSDLERTHFEAGSWTPRAKKPTHWAASWVVPAEWLTRRLADTVGLPINAGTHNFLETRLTSATQDATVNADEALIWRTASYIRSYDGDLINRCIGRIPVAAMPPYVLENLVTALRTEERREGKNGG